MLTFCIFPKIHTLVDCWFAAKLMRGWNWWQVQWANLSVCGGRSLLRTVNAWEMRQLLVDYIFLQQRRPCCCRQALRGAQGHGLVCSRVGGRVVWGTGPLSLSTSISAEARQALSCRPLHSDVSTTLCFTEFFGLSWINSLCSVIWKEEQYKGNKPGSDTFPPNISTEPCKYPWFLVEWNWPKKY